MYEEDTGSLYIHHDITLPAFPLCLAWGHCPPVAGREVREEEEREGGETEVPVE